MPGSHYGMEPKFELNFVHAPTTHDPTKTMMAMTAAEISPIRIEYSIIAAPLSSCSSLIRLLRISLIILAPFRQISLPNRQLISNSLGHQMRSCAEFNY